MSKIALVFGVMMVAHAPAVAAECVTNPRHFDFVNTSAQIFYFGTEQDVRGIYGKLEDELDSSGIPAEATVYYAKGRFNNIVKSSCVGEKCTGSDILNGLQNCSSGPPSPDNTCYPLAAAYKGKLYCMLAPGLDGYGAEKPFKDFNPYEAGR